jgi:hypothetical protein
MVLSAIINSQTASQGGVALGYPVPLQSAHVRVLFVIQFFAKIT